MKSEEIVVGAGTAYPLNGLLTLPEGASGKTRAVVLVHGSGASNMDERVFRRTPFRDLAEGLAARGIASLRYDKRSFVYGKQMRSQPITVYEETIKDALLAAEKLRRDARIDPERVSIVGHSMGAMLAPRIDAEGGHFRSMVLMAGSPFRLEEILVRQLRQAGAAGGIMGAVAKLEDRIFTKKFDGLYEMSEAEAKRKKFAGATTLWYFKEMGRKTAADYLLETQTSALILQGGMDPQVLAEEDFRAFQELLKDRPNTEYRLYETLGHLFTESASRDIRKAMKEFRTEQHMLPAVLDDIAAFLHRS